jgi:hypothetical protein
VWIYAQDLAALVPNRTEGRRNRGKTSGLAHPKGRSMILPKNKWPESLMAYLSERREVEVEATAYGALRAPGGFPVDSEVVTWVKRSLSAMRWRQSGKVWRKPAKA